MKKNFIFALMSAIALTGVTGLTACSDKEELAEVNPGYNAETGEVPVNFVFNVSTESNATTRMSPATVQVSNGSFRGIQDALLLSFKLTNASSNPDDGKYITDGTQAFDKSFDLNALIGSNKLTPEANEASSSHRILEMSLPVGTNTLMMWGRAIKDGTNAAQGSITFNPISQLSADNHLDNITFTTNYCLTADEKTALGQYEELIAAVLNRVVNASSNITASKGGVTITDKTLGWADYVDFNSNGTLTPKVYDPSTYDSTLDPLTNNAKMSPLGNILAKLFVTLNTFGDDELRNAEGKITVALLKDIYDVCNNVSTGTEATTVQEAAAQEVASHIMSVITDFIDVTTPKWNATTTIKEKAGKSSLTLATADLMGFPNVIFHLPPGAAVMKYISVDPDNTSTIKNEYAFMNSVPTYAMGSIGGSFDPNNYIYPAELCYFGNSPIRVTNQERAEADYPNGTSNWEDDDEWEEGAHGNTADWTKNGHVLSSTRSVAMKDNINYGTSMLVTTVKFADLSGLTDTKFHDNNGGLHDGEADNTFTETELAGISLTGVLIGGQTNQVGWNYLPTSTSNFKYMVYDDQLPSGAIPTTDHPNYTMVWDNWNGSKGSDQNKVYVALQFVNNTGKDFWGRNNIIRNKATFYIVGELDPDKMPTGFKDPETNTTVTKEVYKANKSWGITWPTNYALPPYDTDGSGIKERRVFIQDYKTVASFVIGQNSLKSALVSVPDLRSSQLSLGLSVDLQWRQGLTFDDVVLGE